MLTLKLTNLQRRLVRLAISLPKNFSHDLLLAISCLFNIPPQDLTSNAELINISYHFEVNYRAPVEKTHVDSTSCVVKKPGGPNSGDMAAEAEEGFTFLEDGEDDNVQVGAPCHSHNPLDQGFV